MVCSLSFIICLCHWPSVALCPVGRRNLPIVPSLEISSRSSISFFLYLVSNSLLSHPLLLPEIFLTKSHRTDLPKKNTRTRILKEWRWTEGERERARERERERERERWTRKVQSYSKTYSQPQLLCHIYLVPFVRSRSIQTTLGGER